MPAFPLPRALLRMANEIMTGPTVPQYFLARSAQGAAEAGYPRILGVAQPFTPAKGASGYGKPMTMALKDTARGMLRLGLCCSSPRGAAGSNPSKAKDAK